jgi:hypothetical protein
MPKNSKNRPAEASPEATAAGKPASPRIARRVRRRTAIDPSSVVSDTGSPVARKSQAPSVGLKRSARIGDVAEPARMQASPCPVVADNAPTRADDALDPMSAAVIVDDGIEAAFKQLSRGLEAIAASFSSFSGAIGPRRRLTLLEPVVIPTKALLHWAFQIDSALGPSRPGQGPEGRFLEAIYAVCNQVARIECRCREAQAARAVPSGRQRGGAQR